MKKLIFFFAICIFAQSAHSQDKTSAFHVSFVPPLSTNGKEAGEYTNAASFNILIGKSLNEKAFTLGGLANIIGNDANGIQFAGLANTIGNEAKGLQFAGLANIVGTKASGIQFAGLFNIAGSEANSLQFGGLVNITGDKLKGMQFGGLANITGNEVNGAQFAGLANIAGDKIAGFQFAGLGNIVGDEVKGAQFAAIVNRTKNLNGFQFAGIYNRADDVKGAQIAGIVNKANTVKGVQFAALVNIADESDYPIGLVNIIKNGEKSVGVTYNELGSTVVSFRSGGRVMYGILGVGYNHRAKEELVMEGGFGAHIKCSNVFRINTELKSNFMTKFSKKNTNHSSLSVMPAFKVASCIEIFAGPSINYLNSDNVENTKLFPNHNIWKKYKSDEMSQLYVGFSAGAHIIF